MFGTGPRTPGRLAVGGGLKRDPLPSAGRALLPPKCQPCHGWGLSQPQVVVSVIDVSWVRAAYAKATGRGEASMSVSVVDVCICRVLGLGAY